MSMAGFHITEDCAEVYLQNEFGMEFLQLARRLHDYLRQKQRLPARSLFEATDGCKEISREAFDALAKRRMENTGEVSGVFELDFDARTLSALNIMDGWKVYAMKDVADAAAQAYQEAEMSEDDCWRIFLDRLDGRELTTPSRLTARNFYFEDSIEAMDDRILNFYVVPCFNVDEVFGTFVTVYRVAVFLTTANKAAFPSPVFAFINVLSTLCHCSSLTALLTALNERAMPFCSLISAIFQILERMCLNTQQKTTVFSKTG